MPPSAENHLAYDDIAARLLTPFSDISHVKKQIAQEWESARDGKTLDECISECLDEYAQNINTEIGWSAERKRVALAIELKRRIRPKSSIT